MKAVKKTAGILASVLLWSIIVLAALFTFTTLATRDATNVASLGGFTPMSVQSDSMAPTFYQGDMIVIRACDPATLQVGDIICFHTIIENQFALNTHRIAQIEGEGGYRTYVTRGDNNVVEDQLRIADADIVGKYVLRVAALGKVMDFLSTSLGFLLVIVLPLLLFFIYQVYHLIVISARLKKATVLEAAQEAQAQDEELAQLKADAARERAEAQAALEEAKRLREEAEALRKQNDEE